MTRTMSCYAAVDADASALAAFAATFAGLDFAAACLAAFLDFDAVLAMVLNRSGERMETGRNRLTPRLGDVVQATAPVACYGIMCRKLADLQHLEDAEPNQADEDQIDRDDEVQQSRHDQNQDTSNERDDRLDVGGRDGHGNLRCGDAIRRPARRGGVAA